MGKVHVTVGMATFSSVPQLSMDGQYVIGKTTAAGRSRVQRRGRRTLAEASVAKARRFIKPKFHGSSSAGTAAVEFRLDKTSNAPTALETTRTCVGQPMPARTAGLWRQKLQRPSTTCREDATRMSGVSVDFPVQLSTRSSDWSAGEMMWCLVTVCGSAL